MEDCEELDMVPQKVAEGGLSVEEAAMKVMEAVYTNPGRFNLLDMEEDARSDFLLDVLPKFRNMVKRYDKSLGPLGAFVFYSLPGMRLTWEKRRIDRAVGKRAVSASIRNIYEDAMDRKPLRVADSEKPLPPSKGGDDVPLVFKRVFGHPKYSLESRETLHRQRSALVLALKSAWYIDDENVKKVSGYCGCSNKAMAAALERIKNSLVEKNERRQEMAERRDKAWYFVCKYRERLMTLEPGSEEWKKTKKKLDYQISSWKSKNRLLQGCRMRVCLRNKELAKLLNLRPHRISTFLSYARKMAEAGENVFSTEAREEE